MVNIGNNVASVGTVIAKVAAQMLADKTQFLQNIDKEPSTSFDQVNGYNVGQTITINKPARFIPSTGADITSAIQDIVEEKTTLTLNNRQVVPVAMTSAEIQNEIRLKDWTQRILDPAVSAIAQTIEAQFLVAVKAATYNLVGNAAALPTTAIFDTDTVLQAREKLKRNLVPADGKLKILLDSASMRTAVNARKGLFQAADAIETQYMEGVMGKSDGFTFLENNLLPIHQRGTATGAMTITTTVTEGSGTWAITGTGAQTLVIGDVFTVAGVFMLHPITKTVTNVLQQFVVGNNVTASSGAFTGVQVSPAPYVASNGLNNVSALPTATNVVNLWGVASNNYINNIAFHKSAFRFASVPLMKPDGAHMVGQETVDGMTIRVWMDANILTDKMVMRLDFLGGIAPVRPEWACRLPY